MPIKFDGDAFKKAVQDAAQRALDQRGAEMERELERLRVAHQDQTAAQIHDALQAEEQRRGWGWTEAHLKAWSEAMAEGRQVRVVTERINLKA